ncbi:HAD family hydrolase [Limibacter armeniacum]|uniref:HAD family hydrolase n=1 Tax=Limibacter armeniacum TaxID=466084 RepID=UPI002FE538B2
MKLLLRNGYILLILLLTLSCEKAEERKNQMNVDMVKTRGQTLLNIAPLESWKEGDVKTAIMDYVERITDPNSPDFIPKRDRIATFDNDGTLWSEKPLIQGMFVSYRIHDMVEENPKLRNVQPYKAVIEGDKKYLHALGEKGLIDLVLKTHSGMTEEAFEKDVHSFFQSAVHPVLKVPVNELVYKPQLELLEYLREHGFKTYICSGGTVEFIREVGEELYGIPDEQVIGSKFKYKLIDDGIAKSTIERMPELESFNDKQEKPVNIQYVIGQRPVFACGNVGAGGDVYMLRFSQGSPYLSFQLLVNHDDKDREFAYQEEDSLSLRMAKQNDWHVVSMKEDWNRVFANETPYEEPIRSQPIHREEEADRPKTGM